MSQNQNIGLIKKIKSFFARINPRYQLSLDDDYFDIKKKEIKYRFKAFGDHGFPEFTFNHIKYNQDVLFAIHPSDLIKISEKNYIQKHLKYQLKIDEFLRNNKYRLRNDYGANIFSGEEICDNPLLADQIVKSDLYKIAYNTGFERGRRLSKLATHKHNEQKENVIKLHCIKDNNLSENNFR